MEGYFGVWKCGFPDRSGVALKNLDVKGRPLKKLVVFLNVIWEEQPASLRSGLSKLRPDLRLPIATTSHFYSF